MTHVRHPLQELREDEAQAVEYVLRSWVTYRPPAALPLKESAIATRMLERCDAYRLKVNA